jgi:hypothetical protein
MEKPVTHEELMKVTRCLMRMNANAMIEIEAVRNVLLEMDPIQVAQRILPARDQARKHWKPLLDTISEAAPDSLEDILRKFEGPVQ